MKLLRTVTIALLPSVQTAFAEPPRVQTPAPAIHLADNLDEADGLGWCIDTVGRGFGDKLQAHSCKPQGGDVQFSFDAASGAIQSVEFPSKCMSSLEPAHPAFGLVDCNANAAEQRFAYDSKTRSITLVDDPTQCVAVGEQSRSAGPFMSRELLWVSCSATDPVYRTWIVVSSAN